MSLSSCCVSHTCYPTHPVTSALSSRLSFYFCSKSHFTIPNPLGIPQIRFSSHIPLLIRLFSYASLFVLFIKLKIISHGTRHKLCLWATWLYLLYYPNTHWRTEKSHKGTSNIYAVGKVTYRWTEVATNFFTGTFFGLIVIHQARVHR